MDQAVGSRWLPLPGPEAHLQVGAQARRQLPAHDPLTEDVDDEGGVDPADEAGTLRVVSRTMSHNLVIIWRGERRGSRQSAAIAALVYAGGGRRGRSAHVDRLYRKVRTLI